MALSRKRVTDLDTMRAFVHPLRMRLLGSLRLEGPSTASELGRRFGESSGSTSYHLRQLERYGFVIEDDEQPSKRERRWRAAHDVTSWNSADFADDEAGREIMSALQSTQVQLLMDGLQQWFGMQDEWGPAWREAGELSDMHLRLRPDDLLRLGREIDAVITRFHAHQRPADDEAAELVAIHLITHPERRGQP